MLRHRISNNDQWKRRNLSCKIVQKFFQIGLLLRDRHLSMCGLVKFNRFFKFNFDANFLKSDNVLWKNEVQFLSSLHARKKENNLT